jgi:hypothetical protein
LHFVQATKLLSLPPKGEHNAEKSTSL